MRDTWKLWEEKDSKWTLGEDQTTATEENEPSPKQTSFKKVPI